MESLRCPHCGEPIDTFVDPGGASDQSYIEDCSVCCRPIRFSAHWQEEEEDFFVTVSGEI